MPVADLPDSRQPPAPLKHAPYAPADRATSISSAKPSTSGARYGWCKRSSMPVADLPDSRQPTAAHAPAAARRALRALLWIALALAVGYVCVRAGRRVVIEYGYW